MATVDEAIRHLISTYNELNGSSVQELESEPSPLEFMRFVASNTPFVVRGAASSWKAAQKWDKEYLLAALKGQLVNVAVTPHGNADSPTLTSGDDELVFAKPHEESQPFADFLDYVIQQETDPDFPSDAEVRYAQTRKATHIAVAIQMACMALTHRQENDNLRDEYACLFSDVQRDVAFARIALQKKPEAINLWIGNSRSVTATHKDNFENIFVQVKGRKHFVLLPPICQPCVNERLLVPATYRRQGQALVLCRDEDAELVPFATWDPENPRQNATPFSPIANPIGVTLNPGDMLYLPAMWYHKVKQSLHDGDPNGFVVAVNYWYDMEFAGPLFPLSSFLRHLAPAS